MKRLILALLAFLCVALPVLAAGGSVSQSFDINGPRDFATLTITWKADDNGLVANTTIPATTTAQLKGFFLYLIVTDPGIQAPTDNYDIYLYDSHGADALGAAGENRDTTTSEQVMPAISSAGHARPVDGEAMTFALSGNTSNGASGVVKFYFVRRAP